MEALISSRGRRYKDESLLKDPFLEDYLRIIQSKAWRRLAFKTQVISAPDHCHMRTRFVHTNEVMAISMIIAENLGLKKTLCQAGAAGHDVGHAPYGHLAEEVLTELSGRKFEHSVNSVTVAQHIERRGKGLNLSYETLECMFYHSRGPEAILRDGRPLEYAVVSYADSIAYTLSDLNDAIRYRLLDEKDIPECAIKLGEHQRTRTDNIMKALIAESKQKGTLSFSEGEVFDNFEGLKSFMETEIYFKMDRLIHKDALFRLLEFFSNNGEFSGLDPVLSVSLLTDNEANYFVDLLLRSKKPSINQIKHFGIFEILPYIKDKNIDYTDLDLGWEPYRE